MKKGKVIFHSVKLKNLLFATALSGILIIGGIMAYFTSSDAVTNTFTVGSVKIQLEENGYDELTSEQKKILPGANITKDPKVKNIGKNPAYVFVKVTIPAADVRVKETIDTSDNEALEELAGKALAGKIELDHEIFVTKFGTDKSYNTNDWVLVDNVSLEPHTYLYAYCDTSAGKMKELDVDAETSLVFDNAELISNLYAWKQEEIDMLAYSTMKDSEKAAWLKDHPRYNNDAVDENGSSVRWDEKVADFISNNTLREYVVLCNAYDNWLTENDELDESGWEEMAATMEEYRAAGGDKSEWLAAHTEKSADEWADLDKKAEKFTALKAAVAEWLEAHNEYTKSQWDDKKTETSEFYGEFIENSSMNIDVQAFAIQSRSLNVDTPVGVWQVLTGQLNNS